jgi:hypothetical protein
MRGQVAVEYLVIFGAFLTIFGAVIWPQAIVPSEQAATDISSFSRARWLADSVADAINSVYARGLGACQVFLFSLDRSCELILENWKTENGVLRVVRVTEGRENFASPVRYLSSGLANSPVFLPPETFVVRVSWENKAEGLWYENRTLFINIRPA